MNSGVPRKIVFTCIFYKFQTQFYGTSACRPLFTCKQNILKHMLSAFIDRVSHRIVHDIHKSKEPRIQTDSFSSCCNWSINGHFLFKFLRNLEIQYNLILWAWKCFLTVINIILYDSTAPHKRRETIVG